MLWCTEVLQCVVPYSGCIALYRFWLGIPVGFNFECPSKNAYVNGFYDKPSPKSTANAYAAHMHANEIPSHTNRHKLDESNSYLLAFYCYTKSNQSRLTVVVVILLHSPAYIHRAFSAGWRLRVSLSLRSAISWCFFLILFKMKHALVVTLHSYSTCEFGIYLFRHVLPYFVFNMPKFFEDAKII